METDSALDIANLWIGSIAISVELPLELDPGERCYGPLDTFLEARFTIDLPDVGKPAPDIADVGTEGDIPGRAAIPQ